MSAAREQAPADPGPWDGMTYEDLAAVARKALVQAMREPPNSIERAAMMGAYEAAMSEFKRRVLVHAAVKFGLPPVTVPDEALEAWKLTLDDATDIEL